MIVTNYRILLENGYIEPFSEKKTVKQGDYKIVMKKTTQNIIKNG